MNFSLRSGLKEACDIIVERDREIVQLVRVNGEKLSELYAEIATLKLDLESAEDSILENKERRY